MSDMGGLAVGAALVLGFSSACIGVVGTVAELTVKEIDADKHPILRTIGEIFSKTLQSGSAFFALCILGSLFFPSVGAGILLPIGAVMLLTPYLASVLKHLDNPSVKKVAEIADQIVSATSKTINTAVITGAAFLSLGVPGAIVAGGSIGLLSLATFLKA